MMEQKRRRRKKRKKNVMPIVAVVTLAASFVLLGVALRVSGVLEPKAGSGRTSVVEAMTAEAVTAATMETAPETERMPETEAETETTEAPEPVVKTLTLTAVGDCALGKERQQSKSGSFVEYYEKKGADYFLKNFASIFKEDDLTLANLECVLSTETKRKKKTFNIKGDPSYVKILTGSSVEAVSLGNNHTLDYGANGLKETKETLDAAGVVWALDEDVAYYTTEQGLRVAVVSKNVISASKKQKKAFYNTVAACKKDKTVDLVIAACHWGTEKKYNASKNMQNIAHNLIESGADVVIGHHPHVLQGIEVYKGKVICYSLSNFSFGANKSAYDYRTMVYQQTFTFVDGKLQSEVDAKIIPARTSSAEKRNNFQPVIAKGDQKADILRLVNKYSEKFGTTVDDDGVIKY